MKILVDVMPESATKCKFHGKSKSAQDGVYICNVTNKTCPLCENKTCRVLQALKDTAVIRNINGAMVR